MHADYTGYYKNIVNPIERPGADRLIFYTLSEVAV